jgi:5'-methylthioadenosine/S-adenosylhomocysteine nucleosidase
VYLVLGALEGEIKVIRDHLQNREKAPWGPFPVYTGLLEGKPLVLAAAGIGKSLSGIRTQGLIDRYPVEKVIFTGVAGALNPSYRPGDLVAARDCLQHDLDAGPGFEPGEVPFTPYRVFPGDPALLDKARTYRPPEGALRIGRILTGDRFIRREEEREALRRELKGDAVDMEGASAAQAAAINGLGFFLFRTISDRADEQAPQNYRSLLNRAAEQNFLFLKFLICSGEDE